MNVLLTPTLEAYAEEKIRSGRYSDASEVIREALRLLMDRDQQIELLREQVAKGFEQINHGQYTEVNELQDFVSVARTRR